MSIFSKIKSFFTKKPKEEIKHEEKIEKKPQNSKTLERMVLEKKDTKHIHNNENSNLEQIQIHLEDLWKYIDPVNNTQAHHIISIIGFDEWVDMEEIRNRIKQMFFIEYKNEKSLYPYIKTLTDVGLLETTSVGGKRKWKKKELFIKIKNEEKELVKVSEKN